MATRRRRTRRFAGKKGGRNYFWIRDSPTAVTVREVATATHSDILLDESFWQFQSSLANSAQRGGPRLERFWLDYGLSIVGGAPMVEPSGLGLIALLPEFMVWKQSSQFATIVTSSASFDSTREDQRIIMDEVPLHQSETAYELSDGTQKLVRTVRGRYETKSKVRLADSSLGIGWRGFYNEGSATITGYTDWVAATMLVSIP